MNVDWEAVHKDSQDVCEYHYININKMKLKTRTQRFRKRLMNSSMKEFTDVYEYQYSKIQHYVYNYQYIRIHKL